MFEELKSGLEKPLSGMGVAFSSSLFGLSGSLILGFFDLLYNQAQNRFYNELEEWLSTVTEINDERSDSKMNFYLNRNLKDMNSILVELEKAINSESIDKSSELKTVLNSIEQQNKDISRLLSEQNKLQKKIIDEVKKK